MKLMAAIAALSAASVLIATSAATAATITNRDTQTYNLFVIEGEQERQVTVEAEQEISDICASECSIALTEDSELVDIARTDKITIEQGQIYIEASENADAAPGEGTEEGLQNQ